MSAIPDVMDALVSTWQALGLTLTVNGNTQPVLIVDGPPYDITGTVDFIAVGWERSPQATGVTGDGTTEDLDGEREAEVFNVSCLFAAWFGGTTRPVSAVRRAQFDALKTVRASLGGVVASGVCDTATLRGRDWAVAELEGGVASDVPFDIQVTAYGL